MTADIQLTTLVEDLQKLARGMRPLTVGEFAGARGLLALPRYASAGDAATALLDRDFRRIVRELPRDERRFAEILFRLSPEAAIDGNIPPVTARYDQIASLLHMSIESVRKERRIALLSELAFQISLAGQVDAQAAVNRMGLGHRHVRHDGKLILRADEPLIEEFIWTATVEATLPRQRFFAFVQDLDGSRLLETEITTSSTDSRYLGAYPVLENRPDDGILHVIYFSESLAIGSCATVTIKSRTELSEWPRSSGISDKIVTPIEEMRLAINVPRSMVPSCWRVVRLIGSPWDDRVTTELIERSDDAPVEFYMQPPRAGYQYAIEW
jgi:hypothetical protein